MTHVQYVHKMVDVWQVEYVEKIVEVPKVVIQEIEKVVEVPQVKRVETVVVKILEEYGDDLTVVRRGGGYLHGYQVLTPDRGMVIRAIRPPSPSATCSGSAVRVAKARQARQGQSLSRPTCAPASPASSRGQGSTSASPDRAEIRKWNENLFEA